MTQSNELRACPLCNSTDVEGDCFARTHPDRICTEPGVNCNGCGTMFIFDFAALEPWAEIKRRWNTRPNLNTPEMVERLLGAINEARVHLSDLVGKGLSSVDSADELLRAESTAVLKALEQG